jgi:hypothetical protein
MSKPNEIFFKPATWRWLFDRSQIKGISVQSNVAHLADRVRQLRQGEITEDDLLLFIYNL